MFFACRQRARPAWNREEAAHPGLTSELSGAAGKRQLRSQNVTPRPLERPVGRPGLREKAEVAWLLHFAPPHSAQYAEYRYCAFCCVAVNTSVKASNKSCSALRALSKWKTIEPKSSACSFISAILRLALITDFVSLYCSGE